MSMITLFSAFMGLYVIVRLILPSGMNWPFKLILSLFALACAEKLLLTKLVYGTMGAFMPEPVQLASGYLHSAVTILFLLLVVRDALLLLTWPFRRSTGRQRKIFYGHKEKKPASGFWAFTLVLLALALSGYGMREALRVPPVREVRMQVPGLPDALNGFRIAQLSDLHIGPTFGKAWLTDVVARTDSLNPDLIVITGDVVDGSPSRLEEDVAPLADLKAKYGVIFVPGNHEYYSGIQQWLPVFQRLGMHVLMNENTQIRVNGTPLAIAGVTDTAALNWGLEGPDPEKALQRHHQTHALAPPLARTGKRQGRGLAPAFRAHARRPYPARHSPHRGVQRRLCQRTLHRGRDAPLRQQRIGPMGRHTAAPVRALGNHPHHAYRNGIRHQLTLRDVREGILSRPHRSLFCILS